MKRSLIYSFVATAVLLSLAHTLSAPELSARVRAQEPTATPTPTPCPDGQACTQNRYATRKQVEDGDDRVYGIYAMGSTPSVPCWISYGQTYSGASYNLWIIDNSQEPREWVEIGISHDHSGRNWFTGCTICENFHGGEDAQHPLLVPYNHAQSFRIERLSDGNDDCWVWFVGGGEVRNTCNESLREDAYMNSGDVALVGGETQGWHDDLGVHWWTEIAVKLTDSSLPVFSHFAPDDASPKFIYNHPDSTGQFRYGSAFIEANTRSYAPALCIGSDTHWLDIPDYCSGRK